MKLIQFCFLIIIFLTLLMLNTKKKALRKMFSRMGFIFMFFGFVFSLMTPSIIQDVAHFLGVGRGADLVLYVLALGTLIFGMLVYIKIKEIEDKLVKIARELTLINRSSDSDLK